MATTLQKAKSKRRKDKSGSVGDDAPLAIKTRRTNGAEPTRTDHRSANTIEDILAATFTVLMRVGTTKLSVREVCEEANISRGTLYRYFESKEQLVEAAAFHLREQTDIRAREAAAGLTSPAKIFDALVKFTAESAEAGDAANLLEKEPEFILKYFRDNFDYFINRVSDVMTPAYDSWEQELGEKIDRDLISEVFVRFALSETLVPSQYTGKELSKRLRKLFRQVR